MYRYKLRTLLILLVVGPPLIAGAWWTRQAMIERQRQRQFEELIRLIQSTVKPESWNDVGGAGSVDQFDGKLSLISGGGQTVHEQTPSGS